MSILIKDVYTPIYKARKDFAEGFNQEFTSTKGDTAFRVSAFMILGGLALIAGLTLSTKAIVVVGVVALGVNVFTNGKAWDVTKRIYNVIFGENPEWSLGGVVAAESASNGVEAAKAFAGRVSSAVKGWFGK